LTSGFFTSGIRKQGDPVAKKERADVLLAEQGLAENRDKATRLVMAGQVHMLDRGQKVPVHKPGQMVPRETEFVLKGGDRFASRGGYKLLTAIEHFDIDVSGLTALDAGASTGGFTDCLLQFGARHVYAVDVGHGQLDWKLRNDLRVTTMEGINLRHAPADLLPEPVDIIVVDCSFISLSLILPPCLQFLKPGGIVVALVKPQFEVARDQTDRGVVRSEDLQLSAVDKVVTHATQELGLTWHGTVPAAVKGPKGNQEYLIHLKKSDGQQAGATGNGDPNGIK
jgi:23S rRNA (cytidine1920-2'-O)/16S rRNA (cytidine1409-2'-O)-methyltransferase